MSDCDCSYVLGPSTFDHDDRIDALENMLESLLDQIVNLQAEVETWRLQKVAQQVFKEESVA